MNVESIIITILTVVGSIAAGYLAARAELKRVPFQNRADDATSKQKAADALTLYEQAATNRQKENDELRQKLTMLEAKIDDMERRLVGPFRGTIEFTVNPLRVVKADLVFIDELKP